MRKYILIIFIITGLHFAFGFSPTECSYNETTNVLTLQFSDSVKTDNVLLGLLSITDDNSTLTLTGGNILTSEELSDNIEINLVYGTIVDTRSDLKYWGTTNQQAVTLEEMNLSNLTLNVTAGAFLNELYQPNSQNISLPITVTDSEDAEPVINEVEYDAGLNLLYFHFDRIVQFDQIAEDQSCNGGTGNCPGNGSLDGGENSEDANGNGVLEMESNINPFKIQLFSGENEMTLEGFRSVVQTADDSVISFYPNISDAKKLELNIIEPSTSDINVIINKGAFVDLNYNPNLTDTLIVNLQADSTPLIMTDATYDLGSNEFRIYFDNSRDVEIFNPFPVYSKIKVTSGENIVALNGIKQISFSGNTLILSELLFSDQKTVEDLILSSTETINLELEPYAVYDMNGNGNVAGTHVLNVIGEYNDPTISSVSYDAESNKIIIDWSPNRVTFYETTRLYESIESLTLSGITASNTLTGEELDITSAEVSRDNTKTLTYLKISEENSGWFELAGNTGDPLALSVAPYLFFSSGNTNNNGNLTQTDIPIDYNTDVSGPAINSIQIDFETHQLIIGFDKNVQTGLSNFTSVTLLINDSELEINGLTLLNTELTTDKLSYQIPDDQYSNILEAIPSNEIVNIDVILPGDVFNNVDAVSGLGCQDLNDNGLCDTTPEPFLDYGIDNIENSNEPGYPGSCDPAGGCSDPTIFNQSDCEGWVCSDPQYTNQSDCLAPGYCSRPNRPTQELCENNIPPGYWNSYNTWAPAGVWSFYTTESECLAGSASWTPNLDPAGDNYDSVTNPNGTEGNGIYDFGESFTELYPDGIWNPIEPVTKKLSYGKMMWNQSFRAFADPPAEMFFVLPYENDDINVYVEESVWNGRCHDDDIIRGSSCTGAGMEYINGRCVFLDIKDEASCLAIPGTGDWTATWTQVTPQDVMDVANFYLNNKDQLMSSYGTIDGKISIVLYDISDEFGKGSNDTNSSLFTHGYFSIDETPGPEINTGDILYLDVFPQKVFEDFSVPPTVSIPDENTMYNALVHELTKMLITKNEPDEEIWLKEGLAYFEQKRLLGEAKFFGNGTDPGTPAANQLTYISFSKKNRSDQHNVYLFLNYLFEKYSGDTGWEIIDEIATNGYQGIEAVDQALKAMDPSNPDTKDVFMDYATACFLDVNHEVGVYDGKYNMENVDLYGAPSSKNAAALKFDGNKPPPYSIREIPPWSFGFYLIEGFSVSLLDNSVSVKTPLLDPFDDLVFDGYDGINFRVNKIMLKNGFTENMNPMYEVVGFDIDSLTGKGSLPVSTSTIPGEDFEFKKVFGSCEDGLSMTEQACCTENGGIWSGNSCDDSSADWIWSGNMNLVLVIAKVDDTQPPASYDLVVTNITSPQDFSDFYVLQNPGVHNFLDLYVASQRPIFDEFGIEGPKIEIASEFDTTYVLLNSISSPSADLVMYYGNFILGEWDQYTLTYSGMDQSGNPVDTDAVQVITTYSTTPMGRIINSSDDDVGLTIYDTDSNTDQFVYIENPALINREGFTFDTNNIIPMSSISYFGPSEYSPSHPVKVSFELNGLDENTTKIYHMTDNGWTNIGGTVDNGKIRAYADKLGYFLLASGDNHLPQQSAMIIPNQYVLNQNFPNPFNPVTNIVFSIPDDQKIVLNIYNLNGQHIRTLTDGFYSAGEYSVKWDGLTGGGIMAPSGVYFARLSTDNYTKMIKMVLMK